MASPRIAIIGGGPAGLMLARLLKLQDISFRLFESDKSSQSRAQGGTLDIHRDSGQLALKEGGLLTAFEKYARYESAAVKVVGKDGRLAWAYDGSQDGHTPRPEIDRTALRKILLDSLEDDIIISWGKKVLHVEQDSSSTDEKPQYNVVFEGGETEGCFELVVGADGAWSKVRNLLTDTMPYYSGITCIETWVEDIDIKHPDLADRTGKGSCYQFGDANGLFNQRMGDGSVRTYAMLRVPEDWSTTSNIDWADSEAPKRALIDSQYAGWEPLSREFLLRSDGPVLVRPLYMLPVDFRWKTRPGVTVLGDAAHVMTPFAGVGVNLALTDALDLSRAIRAHFQDNLDWATVIRQYEDKMIARAHVNAAKTYHNLTVVFCGEEIDTIARRIQETLEAPEDN